MCSPLFCTLIACTSLTADNPAPTGDDAVAPQASTAQTPLKNASGVQIIRRDNDDKPNNKLPAAQKTAMRGVQIIQRPTNAAPAPHHTRTTHTRYNKMGFNAEALLGTYTADLHCNDCKAVRVNVTFNADHSYQKTLTYVGTKHAISESGRWEAKNEHIRLIPNSKSQSPVRNFRYRYGALILVTPKGNDYQGDPAKYLFRKL